MSLKRFDHLIAGFRTVIHGFHDRRTGSNIRYSMEDIALSAFAVFFAQCPSFLAYQKAMQQNKGQSNAQTLFQIGDIPTDNHVRKMLDPVPPETLFPVYDSLYEAFRDQGILATFQGVHNTTLIALHTKQDCEIAAAKRWLEKNADFYLPARGTQTGNATFLGDDLSTGVVCPNPVTTSFLPLLHPQRYQIPQSFAFNARSRTSAPRLSPAGSLPPPALIAHPPPDGHRQSANNAIIRIAEENNPVFWKAYQARVEEHRSISAFCIHSTFDVRCWAFRRRPDSPRGRGAA